MLKNCTAELVTLSIAISILIICSNRLVAQVIWNGPDHTFTKLDGADWTLIENQDSLTENVILTRAEFKSLFNIKQESQYNEDEESDDFELSPIGTEWAIGHTSNLPNLVFAPWKVANERIIKPDLETNYVVHLITDDIYINIVYNSWSGGGNGGFSYTRSTPPLSDVYIEGAICFTDLDTINDGTHMLVVDGEGKWGWQEIVISNSNIDVIPSSKPLIQRSGSSKRQSISAYALEITGDIQSINIDTALAEQYMLVQGNAGELCIQQITNNLMTQKDLLLANKIMKSGGQSTSLEVNGPIKITGLDTVSNIEYMIVIDLNSMLHLQRIN